MAKAHWQLHKQAQSAPNVRRHWHTSQSAGSAGNPAPHLIQPHKLRPKGIVRQDPRVERLPCTHSGTYADDCICERVRQHKCYIVATCDRDLRRRLRKACAPCLGVRIKKLQQSRAPMSCRLLSHCEDSAVPLLGSSVRLLCASPALIGRRGLKSSCLDFFL